MKDSHLLKAQPDRDSLAENLALTLALPAGLVAAVCWFLLFYSTHAPIGVAGWPAIGVATLINASVITFVGFLFGYIRGQKALNDSDRIQLSKPKKVFDYSILALGYSIIAVVITALAITLFSRAFIDVKMPAFSAALVVAVFATINTYAILSISVKLQARDIVNALTLFITAGVVGSMTSSPNRYWWEINFSSLGTTSTASAYAFNVTLVLSGLLLLCLTDFLLQDLQKIIKGSASSKKRRTQIVKYLFVLISLSLAGVGLFPWDIHPLLHTGSAYLLIIWFAGMILGLRWLIPNLSKSFFANSYIILVVLVLSFMLWRPLHYFDQTAFELIAFCLTFIWLVLFLRTITNMRELIESK